MRSLRWLLGPLFACLVTAPHGTLAAAARPVLPWIEDYYARAVAEAKARRLPMFVESWALW